MCDSMPQDLVARHHKLELERKVEHSKMPKVSKCERPCAKAAKSKSKNTSSNRVKSESEKEVTKFVETDEPSKIRIARDNEGRSMDTRTFNSDNVTDPNPEIESIRGNKIISKDGVEMDLDEHERKRKK